MKSSVSLQDDDTSAFAGPHILVREPGNPPRRVRLTGTELMVGRSRSAAIPIGLPTLLTPIGLPDISRTHARITPKGFGYAIVDLSTNGTFLNGRRLPSNQPVDLAESDVIRIGDVYGNSVSLTYHESRGGGGVASTGVRMLGQTILGNTQRLTIGRDRQNDLPLDSPVVSRRHAEIILTDRGHELVDLGSSNGTFVNGARAQRVQLHQGDIIQIGPYRLAYSLGGIQRFSNIGGVRLDAISLEKEVKGESGTKTLLRDVTLSILPKEFVALVGGSGAGKTTLLVALNGARPATRGKVLVNGEDLYDNFDAYRTSIGYVPQTDTIHGGLPVEKALKYTAQLRLPPDTPTTDIEHRIDDVLKTMDMVPQKHQMISKLSGGQRKRVNIASELLSEPNLLFLDEPTSGLDPGLDKKMMRSLNAIADSGRTVVLVTHATNNIVGSCDQVAFLAYGRLVYYGPPEQALQFFNAPDFATIYGKLEKPQDAQLEETRFRKSAPYQQFVAERAAARTSPLQQRSSPARGKQRRFLPSIWLRQLAVLAHRYFELITNDRFSLFVLLGVMPLIGALILVIAKPNSLVGDTLEEIQNLLTETTPYNITSDAQRLIQVISLTVIMLGTFAAAYEIIKERSIYERERMANLGIAPYVLSKILILLLFAVVQCFAFVLVIASKVNLPADGVFLPGPLEIYITLLLATLSGICLGLLISAVVKSSDSVVYLMLVAVVFQIIFSGAMFDLPKAAEWLSYFTQTRWAMEALGSTVNMDYLNGLNAMLINGIRVETPVEFNLDYASNVSHLIRTWIVQLLFAAGLAILTGIVLKRDDRH